MPPAPHALPPFGVPALVTAAFRAFLRHFGFLFPLAFFPLLAAEALIFLATGVSPMSPAEGQAMGLNFVLALSISLLIGVATGGALCLAALDALLGTRHSLGDYVRQTLRHLPPLLALSILVSLAMGLGFALFVLPGIYVAARFVTLLPAILFENLGWRALDRAQSLTAGYRWPIAGAILAASVFAVTILLGVGYAAALAGEAPVLDLLLGFAAQIAYYVFAAVFSATIYLRLREIKEGETAEAIAASIG